MKAKLAALDRDAAINAMVNTFGLSKMQAQEVVQSSIGMIEPLKGKAQDVKEQSVAMANTMIKNLASVAWWMFVLAMLSLFATLGGGALGIAEDLRMELEGRPVIRPAHAGVWRWVAECRMGREECHNLSFYGWKRRACLMMRIPQAAKCISLQTVRAARPTTKQAYHAPRDAKL